MPDIGERTAANYDNPIDTNYAHEHAAYERGYREALAARDAEVARDAARLDWLEENEADVVTRQEECGDDEYAIWWWVAKGGKSLSGHPLGSPRQAIDAAIDAAREGQ